MKTNKLVRLGVGTRALVLAVGVAGPVAAATPAERLPDGTTVAGSVPAVDHDLTGDGKPDLLAVGGTSGLASGLWLASGHTGRGGVNLPAVNLGVNGNGVAGDDSPTDFDGAQVITGKFTGGSFEDFLVYYPSGVNPGFGMVINGTGDGTPPNPDLGGEHTFTSGALSDDNGNDPIQLANAYNSSGSGRSLPDLFGIVGDPFDGYTLDYYPSNGAIRQYQFPTALSLATPTGGTDWENWRIYSELLPSGTALLLWNPTTGGLYLWEGVTFDAFAGALSFTQYTLAATWQPVGTPSTLQLTDFNDDGVPDVWAVTPSGDVTAYVVAGLSTTCPAKLKTQPSQHL